MDGKHKVSLIILAAGKSSRFGRDKMLTDLCGKPLIRYAIDSALGSSAFEIILVTNQEFSPMRPVLPSEVRAIVNPNPANGMSSSIASGVQALASDSCSCVILVGDQPLVTSKMIDTLIELHRFKENRIIAYSFNNEIRNPVLFPRAYFQELSVLKGNSGARNVILKNLSNSELVHISEESSLLDVDDSHDYDIAKKLIQSGKDG